VSWPSVKLGDVCEFKYGKSLAAKNRDGGEFPVYGSNGIVGWHSAALTSGPTIIVGRKGSFGEVAYASGPCWPIDTAYYIDSSSTEADLKWLSYRLSSIGLTSLNRAAAVPGLNREDAYRQELLLPSLDEQRRIASILDCADRVRSKRRRSLEQLTAISTSLFFDMFGDPAASYGRYPVVPLAELIQQDRPITYGILKPGPDIEDGVPYVRVADMKGGGIDLRGVRRTTQKIADEYKRSTLRSGDLLMSIRGHVGRFAFVPQELDRANITQDSARLAVIDSVSPVYVRAAMEMPGLQQWMVRHTKGVAVQGINLGDLKRLPIPCPPPAEQQKFAAAMKLVDEQRYVAVAQLESMDECIAGLRSRAFSGEL
jgi:type I restriction enzyme S subunit